jgi:hypothetical protein
MSKEKAQTFLRWLKEPPSWLALSAAVVSISTFFLVYANPGKLQVVLPVDVGLRLAGSNLELLASVTLTNTGAPRTRRHVVTLLAELRPQEQPDIQPVALRWESEWAFIGYLEFNKKYPGQGVPAVEDYIEYVSRAAPFAVAGSESITKVMRFRQRSGSTEKRFVGSFQLRVIARTENKEFTQTAVFRCAAEIGEAKYDWCEKV